MIFHVLLNSTISKKNNAIKSKDNDAHDFKMQTILLQAKIWHLRYLSHRVKYMCSPGKCQIRIQMYFSLVCFTVSIYAHNFSISIDDAAPPPLQIPANPFSPGFKLCTI